MVAKEGEEMTEEELSKGRHNSSSVVCQTSAPSHPLQTVYSHYDHKQPPLFQPLLLPSTMTFSLASFSDVRQMCNFTAAGGASLRKTAAC